MTLLFALRPADVICRLIVTGSGSWMFFFSMVAQTKHRGAEFKSQLHNIIYYF